jgi:2-amino-4-hydroxy-6-hydroxymethyldihydropteridine diphosphokinase
VKDEYNLYLELGSNIEPERNLPLAIELLRELVHVVKISSVWESPAVGASGPNFLNLAIQIQSVLPPAALKHLILRNIEAQLGRQRTESKNAPRTIDIDIVIVDGKVVDDQVWKHAHLAMPLAELIPEIKNESSGESLEQTSERLSVSEPICQRTDINFDETA